MLRTIQTCVELSQLTDRFDAVGRLVEEWAHLRPYASNDERTDALGDFLHRYNSGDSGCVFTAELGRPLRPQHVGDQFSCSPARQGSRLRHAEFDRTPGYAGEGPPKTSSPPSWLYSPNWS
ncbi:hypothetical protein [Microbispora bryophytorum]|uniref:Uncharacterized protein n=1 Tax=Microbispora bryophytorum TaxID=1460882 RepID=A0A8H9LA34_9ACTN|nr:hypothetical protein [Microbispora bryophytorum]MBD3136150.1 hypothetical protein [Microbispora bryophytorum]TQS07890.1 hypothetical protein FLX07_08790 [Microbispora bryophytorum]GGO04778.1 hypothetical protein GCM10011574_15900 [Microbispora bryophytorum]